jgi:Flp pilus assembly protein TadD
MKKLFIIAAMVTLLTSIIGQKNQAKAQQPTSKIVYVISVERGTGRVMSAIRDVNMATKLLDQGLYHTTIKVGDSFAVERQNTPYNGTLNWHAGKVLQVVNSGGGSAVFRAIGPGAALLFITPEGQSKPDITIKVDVSQAQSQSGPVAAPRPVPATQGQDPTLELQKQGIEYRKKKMFTQALQAFNQGLEMNPRHAWLYFQRGITHLQMKNPDLAISDFNQALSINPNAPKVAEIYYFRGWAYGYKKQYDSALKDLSEALKSNPNANKYYWRGRIYEFKGQYLPAIGDFEQAIKLEPSDPRAYFSKASCLDKSGRQKEAIEAYQVYLRYAKQPKGIQRANERISELKDELKPLVKKAKPVGKKPIAQAETDHFSGPLGEEAF